MKRRPAKLPEVIFVCIIVLGIYLYVFINDFSNRHYGNPALYLPAVLGGIGALITGLFTCTKSELISGLMFSSALLLTGIYQGLSGLWRLVVGLISIVLQIGATIFFIRLYIAKKRKKKEKVKPETDYAEIYRNIFTVLIILTVLQLIQVIALLVPPTTLFKAIPIWIILLGGGAIIITLIVTLLKRDVPLLLLLVANVIIFVLLALMRGFLFLTVNIILLLLIIGTIFYIAKKYSIMFGKNIHLSKAILIVTAVLLISFIATYAVTLFK